MKYLLFFLLTIATQANATDAYKIGVPEATIYDGPSETSKSVGKLKQNRSVNLGETQNGFRKIKTKSGRNIWIKESEVTANDNVEADIEENKSKHPQQQRDFSPHFSYDLSAGAGSYN